MDTLGCAFMAPLYLLNASDYLWTAVVEQGEAALHSSYANGLMDGWISCTYVELQLQFYLGL